VPSIAPRTPPSQPGNYVPSNPVTCHKQPGHMSQATRSHVTNQPGHMSQATRSHVTNNPVTCHKQPGHMSQTNPVTCHKPIRSHVTSNPVTYENYTAVNRCQSHDTLQSIAHQHSSIHSLISISMQTHSFLFFILTTQQMREIHHNILFLRNRSSTETRLIIRFKC